MDYRYLKVFIDAAETLNFAATAKNQKIAPSAVTRQIQLLEESIGEPLFIRSNQKTILTEKGREVLELMRPLQAWQKKQKRRTVRVSGLAAALQMFFWPKVLGAKLTSTMNLDITEAVSRDSHQLLSEGRVDMALVNRKEESSIISYFPLGSEKFVLISKSKVALDEVPKQTWVFGESGDLLRQATGFKNDVSQIRVSSLWQIIDLVSQGAGVAVVPDTPCIDDFNVYKRPISLKAKPIYLAVLNYSVVPKEIAALIKVLT